MDVLVNCKNWSGFYPPKYMDRKPQLKYSLLHQDLSVHFLQSWWRSSSVAPKTSSTHQHWSVPILLGSSFYFTISGPPHDFLVWAITSKCSSIFHFLIFTNLRRFGKFPIASFSWLGSHKIFMKWKLPPCLSLSPLVVPWKMAASAPTPRSTGAMG